MFWLNGVRSDASRLSFDVTDRGLLLADGVFDTSLVLRGTMVWRAAHLDRLIKFGQALGFAIDRMRIEEAIDALLAPDVNGSLRLTVTRGPGPRGIAPPREPHPTILATTAPLRAEALFAPVRLHVTGIRRNDSSPAARVKSLAYLDAVLAVREAAAVGCDEALFLNSKQHVACTGIGNIFAVCGDQILTPPLEDGIVPGIARRMVLDACEELGLEALERSLLLPELERADALFVSGSLRLIAPVTAVGRREFPSTSAGPVEALVAALAQQIRAETGVDPRRLG